MVYGMNSVAHLVLHLAKQIKSGQPRPGLHSMLNVLGAHLRANPGSTIQATEDVLLSNGSRRKYDCFVDLEGEVYRGPYRGLVDLFDGLTVKPHSDLSLADTPLAFTPEGNAVVKGSGSSLKLIDLATGEPSRTISMNGFPVAADFSLNHDLAVVSDGSTRNTEELRVHRADGPVYQRTMTCEPMQTYADLKFSRDGKRVMLASGRGFPSTVKVIDGTCHDLPVLMEIHDSCRSGSVADFSPDGKEIAVLNSDRLQIYEARGTKPKRRARIPLVQKGYSPCSLAYLNSGMIVAGMYNSHTADGGSGALFFFDRKGKGIFYWRMLGSYVSPGAMNLSPGLDGGKIIWSKMNGQFKTGVYELEVVKKELQTD